MSSTSLSPHTVTAAGMPPAPQLSGDSLPMQALRAQIGRIARCGAPVAIRGESGTGKELAARAIHAQGARASFPFIAVNCGAIPEALMEAEFFGCRPGAYTGALHERRGDLQVLCEVILARLSPRRAVSLAPPVLAALAAYAFPGNVRELESVLERALAFADGGVIALDGLALASTAGSMPLRAAPALPAAGAATVPARHGGVWRGPCPAAGHVFAPGRARHDHAGAGAGALPPRAGGAPAGSQRAPVALPHAEIDDTGSLT